MATAFRLGGSTIYIRAALDFPDDPQHVYLLRVDDTNYTITHAQRNGRLLELADWQFEMERILSYATSRAPCLVVRDAASGDIRLVEDLNFLPSFYAPFVDFIRNPDIPPFAMGVYEKPERLAVFTHVHNDTESLGLWERHYANFVPHRHLYVIDHGSQRKPSAALHADTQIISIPRGAVDHINISQFCGYFQRFLLSQYRWVIHVDSDELLVHEGGVAAFLEKLGSDGYGPIVKAGNGAELLDHTEGAEPLDPGRKMSLQRHVLNGAPNYRKPVLAREPTSWGLGFHWAFEESRIKSDPALWLLHVRYADLHMAARREGIWTDAPQSESARLFTPQDHCRDTLDGLRDKINSMFADDRRPMPAWMRGSF